MLVGSFIGILVHRPSSIEKLLSITIFLTCIFLHHLPRSNLTHLQRHWAISNLLDRCQRFSSSTFFQLSQPARSRTCKNSLLYKTWRKFSSLMPNRIHRQCRFHRSPH